MALHKVKTNHVSNTQKKQPKSVKTAILNERLKTLSNANKTKDIFHLVHAFKTFDRNGLDAILVDIKAEDLLNGKPPGRFTPRRMDEGDTMAQIFQLTKSNMESLYDIANFMEEGWSDTKKWKELTDSQARYIIIHESLASEADKGSPGKFLGFVHYRFEMDNENRTEGVSIPIVYIWDLQLVSDAQKKGLGKHLMNVLELAARRLQLHKLMCTVLKANSGADKFYREKCCFVQDESSPDNFMEIEDEEPCEYRILKKDLISARPLSSVAHTNS